MTVMNSGASQHSEMETKSEAVRAGAGVGVGAAERVSARIPKNVDPVVQADRRAGGGAL